MAIVCSGRAMPFLTNGMKKNILAFIDLETTGLDPEKQEIIEIGLILAQQNQTASGKPIIEVLEEIELKVKPEHLELAEPEALRINGYNEADWMFAVDLKNAMELIAKKTEGAVMVAHNITFDWSFLEEAFAKTGVENKMDVRRLDTLSMAYVKLYHEESVQRFSLHYLAQHYGIKNENAHTALADTRTTLEIYKRIIEK